MEQQFDSSPLVSIGVPVYNGERHLARALESVLAQDLDDWEVIVADNASTDGTAEICRRFAAADRRIRFMSNPINLGASPNFARVLAEARGRYFTWLACDDLLYSPQYLHRTADFLEHHPDVVLCSCDLYILDFAGPGILTPYRLPEIYPDRSPPEGRRPFFLWPQSHVYHAIYGMYRREELAGLAWQGRRYRGRPLATDMEFPILLPLLARGRIVALPEPLRAYRFDLQSSQFQDRARLSGFDQFLLGLHTKLTILRAVWPLRVPWGEKLALFGQAMWNFGLANILRPYDYRRQIRIQQRERQILRGAARDRWQVIGHLRAESERRPAILRSGQPSPPAQGVAGQAWPAALAFLHGHRDSGCLSLPHWFEDVIDVCGALFEFFEPPAQGQIARWNSLRSEVEELRRACELLKEEIDRLAQEAERLPAALPSHRARRLSELGPLAIPFDDKGGSCRAPPGPIS